MTMQFQYRNKRPDAEYAQCFAQIDGKISECMKKKKALEDRLNEHQQIE